MSSSETSIPPRIIRNNQVNGPVSLLSYTPIGNIHRLSYSKFVYNIRVPFVLYNSARSLIVIAENSLLRLCELPKCP